ncbi:BREX-1 system adenine-specific DNA-methyltransferase PglX [Arthrobacter sp. PAMC25284]|uniref:BREX-1 system adenine-specific DNA-methyltransferase PglX n=1 Tax=Arthrobacter sp. PAMC25284 TaxID=2861279 RepID=UPI001C627608|nr:BREX-1 system adenine-specific DNA-methyltransferase PglX [Arthrobacter sp. PAMC25284]QYF88487.1 BREX-1 system adenine-specific DNA-methyltransferase PglX [Arthrobacter sp. PAMC25284]
MDTKPLERFATQARRELLAAVDAQATALLAPGSVTRTERGEVVKKLEAEIVAHGRTHVIDKVAYTWFNRIIALRFMDARGYNDAGVVSPTQGQAHGQPEILADAKRGSLNTDVVSNKNTAEAIIGLLDGTRRSTNAEGEAYALLLTEYCRYWYKSMPYMFERAGDYTELLVPTGLLADGAILSRAREVLTDDVCDDVEVIGWLYQFYISERKQEIFDSKAKRGAAEIPAATQLFTPHWIVRYLVENSLGRLWMLNRPTSRLVEQMDYYIAPADEENDFLKIAGPEELSVIDPACGSGHILTYAFDLLYAIYEEEGYAPADIPGLILTRNLYGTEIDPRAGALAAFALTMKARAKQRTFFNKQVEPNVCVIEPIWFGPDELEFLVTKDGDRYAEEAFWNQFCYADALGALVQSDPERTKHAESVLAAIDSGNDIIHERTLELAHKTVAQAKTLSRQYAVAAANPPYMGSKNLDARLADFLKDAYPEGKQDLYGCFVLRAMSFVLEGGFVAKIIGDTWMSIFSFQELRTRILDGHSFNSFVHLRDVSNHPDIFGANAAFVLSMTNSPGRHAPFIRLTPLNEQEKRLRLIKAISDLDCEWRFTASSNDLAKVPGSPIAYWLSEKMRSAFSRGRPLREVAEPRKGMDTGDNARYLRCWWEVSRRATSLDDFKPGFWLPYNKGGGFRRWYGYREYLVDWRREGSEMRTRSGGRYFGRDGWTWGTVTSGGLSMRYTPQGAAFDNGGCTLFSDEDLSSAALVLNSTTADAILAAIAPTLNFQPINIGAVPLVVSNELHESAQGRVEALVQSARTDWDDFETSWDFESPSLMRVAQPSLVTRYKEWAADWKARSVDQQMIEAENNRVVADGYELAGEVPTDVPIHRVSLTRNVEFRYGPGKTSAEYELLDRADSAAELISYAVGCMFGRYSLDEAGLILADQGATLQDYLARIPSPTFRPDTDNVVPFVDDGWFEDDIVERFRQFLRAAFGTEYFEENLRFVEESLGVKSLRDYFITRAGKSKFYDDHVQRYKKRPIYWMFSSPRGSFNALIYMHRYNPSTVSTVLNEYLREYRAKLEVALTNAEQAAAAGSPKDQKEADRLRKVLAELRDYEHDVLYPLATQQLTIDLDEGVKVNYPKFYPALKKIARLEAAE